jgi:hypothetical protein
MSNLKPDEQIQPYSSIDDKPTIASANSTDTSLGATDGVGKNTIPVHGTESLFNPFYIFRYSKFGKGTTATTPGAYDANLHFLEYTSANVKTRLLDGSDKLKASAKDVTQNPSAFTIIDWANKNNTTGQTYPYPYSTNDFMWCKWYGKIPNNRLLTLRRYPIPVEDNLQSGKLPLVPIAQAVTWWGEGTGNKISDVLNITYGFKWNDISADQVDVEGNELNIEKLFEVIGIKNPNLQQALKLAFGSSDGNPFAFSGYDQTLQDFTKKNWESGAYWNRVRGPVNVINSTKLRDRGYDYSHTIKLDFEYSLRSYSNLNPKVALLELMSNMFALTSNTASFWGGGYRYFQKTGALLPGFSTDAMEKGDYTGASKDVMNLISQIIQGGGTDIKKFIDQIGVVLNDENIKSQADVLSKTIAETPIANKLLSSRLASLHQTPLLMRSLLDGRAVGEWHVMVGNPMDPIAVIGNLCLKSTTLTFSEELGAHDFPVSVKFTVTLEPGRPRAKQDIASMFNHGGGDFSFTPLAASASEKNTFGEYNSAKAISAGETQLTKDNNKSISSIQETTTPNSAAEYSKYFQKSVERRYGELFGNSPVLVDYFTKLQTKD